MITRAVSMSLPPVAAVLFAFAPVAAQENLDTKPLPLPDLIVEDSQAGFDLCIHDTRVTKTGKWMMQKSSDLQSWEDAGAMIDRDGLMVFALEESKIDGIQYYRAVIIAEDNAEAPVGGVVENAAQDDLDAARGQWAAEEANTDYVFDLYSNFSLFLWQGNVVVSGGDVVSQTRTFGNVDDNSEVRTIVQLFDLIQDAITRNAEVNNVTYHSELGYPVSAFFDYTTALGGDERGFSVSNLILNLPQ